MGASGGLFFLQWFLAFLSPLAAIFFGVRFYAVHRRRRLEHGRHLPVAAYVVILLVSAIVAFPFGLFIGISAACSSPGASNLCGLFGVFVSGPVASSLGIFIAGGLIAALPADEPVLLSAGGATPLPADEAPRPAKTGWIRKLWRGDYSLGRSFWGFFILGTLIGMIIGMNALFLPVALLFRLVFLAYQVAAGVGVWRSADRLVVWRGAHAAMALSDSMKVIAAKLVVVLFIGIHAILLFRTLGILFSNSHA
jgi:hypothetical protein